MGVRACVGVVVAMATFFVMDGASAKEPIGTVLGAAETVRAKEAGNTHSS